MSRYWKAIIAYAVPLVYALSELISDALGDGEWTAQDTKAVLLGLVGATLVLLKANTPPAGQPSDPNISETASKRERGERLA